MLTNERQKVIIDLLKEKRTIKIQEIVDVTNASESTIRRDLTELENEGKLKRIHGGATMLGGKFHEPSILDKTAKNIHEKQLIAKKASSLIQESDCVFLDAGTTTLQMIPYLEDKKVIVVTNGLTHVEKLVEHGITTYLTGGYVKGKTGALVGPQTIDSIENYRFDKCFLGVNGFDLTFGYTTPDPEEAAVKRSASEYAKDTYILADGTKYEEVSFSNIGALDMATLITSELTEEAFKVLNEKTTVKVVTT